MRGDIKILLLRIRREHVPLLVGEYFVIWRWQKETGGRCVMSPLGQVNHNIWSVVRRRSPPRESLTVLRGTEQFTGPEQERTWVICWVENGYLPHGVWRNDWPTSTNRERSSFVWRPRRLSRGRGGDTRTVRCGSVNCTHGPRWSYEPYHWKWIRGSRCCRGVRRSKGGGCCTLPYKRRTISSFNYSEGWHPSDMCYYPISPTVVTLSLSHSTWEETF